jgi:hypothetical protein
MPRFGAGRLDRAHSSLASVLHGSRILAPSRSASRMPTANPAPINSASQRAVERWLEGLCDYPAGDPVSRARVVFILDNDYGEFTTIMYLISGQDCFRDAKILVSPRLYEKNYDAVPGRLQSWTSEADLVDAIETARPEVVIFASAYLLPVHELLSVDALDRLCALCRRNNIVVVTADPFLGLLSQWSSRGLDQLISIDVPRDANEHLLAVKRSVDAFLQTTLTAAEKVLRPFHHLYPSHTDMDSIRPTVTDGRNVCFFNDALLLPPQTNEHSCPHWMFVISLVDFHTQALHLGIQEFAAIVRKLLVRTAELGRHAVFLGPDPLIDVVERQLAANERISLLRFCEFKRIMSLLLTAEYTFYWNVVSHSILMQLWNGRPVMLFDRGHLARAVPAIYERVIAWYYQGWEPPYLDHEAQLSLETLDDLATAHAQQRANITTGFRRAPSPAELLASLLDR